MRRVIQVYLGDDQRLIGRVRYDQQGARESAVFEYDAEWLAAGDSFTIDPALQLVAGPQFHKKSREGSVFHAAIADTEPDGWGRRVIQPMARPGRTPPDGRNEPAAETRP